MRLFNPPIIPETGLFLQGGFLQRGDVPAIAEQFMIYKSGTFISGDALKVTSRFVSEKMMREQGLIRGQVTK